MNLCGYGLLHLLVDVMFQWLHSRSVTSMLALANGHRFPSGRWICSRISFANKSWLFNTNRCISSNPNTPVLPNSRWGTSVVKPIFFHFFAPGISIWSTLAASQISLSMFKWRGLCMDTAVPCRMLMFCIKTVWYSRIMSLSSADGWFFINFYRRSQYRRWQSNTSCHIPKRSFSDWNDRTHWKVHFCIHPSHISTWLSVATCL